MLEVIYPLIGKKYKFSCVLPTILSSSVWESQIWKIRKISFLERLAVHYGTAWLDNDMIVIKQVFSAFPSWSESNQVSCVSELSTETMSKLWHLEEGEVWDNFYCSSIVCKPKND